MKTEAQILAAYNNKRAKKADLKLNKYPLAVTTTQKKLIRARVFELSIEISILRTILEI